MSTKDSGFAARFRLGSAAASDFVGDLSLAAFASGAEAAGALPLGIGRSVFFGPPAIESFARSNADGESEVRLDIELEIRQAAEKVSNGVERYGILRAARIHFEPRM